MVIPMSASPILTVRDLSATFPDNNGGLQALERVSFEVCPREFVAVLGPSGVGERQVHAVADRRGTPASHPRGG